MNLLSLNPSREQALADQLQINDQEIQVRKALFNFTLADEQTLFSLRTMVDKHVDRIVEAFYTHQLTFRDIARLIEEAETLRRLKTSMRRYILELFEGQYDADYVNRRLHIGRVHQQLGVTPKLYVAAVSKLRQLLSELIEDQCGHYQAGDQGADYQSALGKLLLFDLQLVFDTYIFTLITEVDAARVELESYTNTLEDMVASRTAQLKEMAMRDALTGLYNQRAMYEILRRELATVERAKEPLTLIYFDLNGFKQLNDNHGHLAGDQLLATIGQTLLASVRESDYACRCGGDEFCIILPRADLDTGRFVYERLLTAYDAIGPNGVTFSAGVAQAGPVDYCHGDDLVRTADMRMYQAKARSKQKCGHYLQLD